MKELTSWKNPSLHEQSDHRGQQQQPTIRALTPRQTAHPHAQADSGCRRRSEVRVMIVSRQPGKNMFPSGKKQKTNPHIWPKTMTLKKHETKRGKRQDNLTVKFVKKCFFLFPKFLNMAHEQRFNVLEKDLAQNLKATPHFKEPT